MIKQPDMPDCSILENELARVAEQEKIDGFKIIETADGFYVVASIKARKPESLYLSTRREPEQPRLFRDLERLNSLLRELYPNGSIELECVQKYQAKSKKPVTKKKPASKKRRASKKAKARK